MMEGLDRKVLEKGLRVLWVIWGAMLGSLLIYLFICYHFGEKIRGSSSLNFPISSFRNGIYIVVVITLGLVYFMRKRMLARSSGSGTGAGTNPSSDSNHTECLAKYTTIVMVSLGLSESIGIYGLLLFLLGDGLRTLYAFIGISAMAIIHYRPKREELEQLVLTLNQHS